MLNALSQLPITTLTKMADLPVYRTANEFSLHIEKLASEKQMTHMEAVLEFCDNYKLEPSDISSKISKSLKAKIEQDFRDLNYLPKLAQLDI